jgi:hypothetical protein
LAALTVATALLTDREKDSERAARRRHKGRPKLKVT